MELLIVTAGSRGDVQPYLALGQGLQRAGHQVVIAADEIFAPLVQEAGLQIAVLRLSPMHALQADLKSMAGNPLKMVQWTARHALPLARPLFEDLLGICKSVDGVIYSALGFAGYHVAESLGIPSLSAYLQPMTPTREFSTAFSRPLPPWLPARGWVNWIASRMTSWAFVILVKNMVNTCRQEILSLEPLPTSFYLSIDISPRPVVYGFSQHVLPKPADWGELLYLSGYWFLERSPGWHPSSRLKAFLDAGEPPVYVGFGSMPDNEALLVTQMVVEALTELGQRGILLGGWARLGEGELPENILRLDYAPHDWLFQHVRAVVHHGGAGTTATGLRAGLPSVVVPFFADQPFWGWRVYDLGAGPRPILRKHLTSHRLAEAIHQALTDEDMRKRAARLGSLLSQEDGVSNAVSFIEKHLGV